MWESSSYKLMCRSFLSHIHNIECMSWSCEIINTESWLFFFFLFFRLFVIGGNLLAFFPTRWSFFFFFFGLGEGDDILRNFGRTGNSLKVLLIILQFLIMFTNKLQLKLFFSVSNWRLDVLLSNLSAFCSVLMMRETWFQRFRTQIVITTFDNFETTQVERFSNEKASSPPPLLLFHNLVHHPMLPNYWCCVFLFLLGYFINADVCAWASASTTRKKKE